MSFIWGKTMNNHGAAVLCLALVWALGTAPAAAQFHDPPGKHYEFKAEELPDPGAGRRVMNFPQSAKRPSGAKLYLPDGFKINVFAEGGFRQPRNVQVAPNGDFFVVDSGANQVLVLRDTDGDGKADFRGVFAKGFKRPFGVAFRPGYIYIANTGSVVRFAYEPGDSEVRGEAEVIVPDLPAGGRNNHWTRNLMFSPDGTKLYITVGSASNLAEEPERRATILEANPDGSGLRLFARGLRNPVGLGWNEKTGMIWTAVNERDSLGDDLVPDYVTSVRDGGFYGWPYFYIGSNPDSRMKGKGMEWKDKVIVPDVLVESHSASLGLCFYGGDMFPAEYKGDLFVAFHGSWNRSVRTGYKIVRIRFDENGLPKGGYENFLTGWLTDPMGSEVWGRPVMVTEAPDGALLVVDDTGNKIWRISHGG